jgi:hypothetical protein
MIDLRYQRGKIYTIRNVTDDEMIYVGSTINELYKRFHRHKCDCKCGKSKISLYNYITDNNWNGWYIELYETYPCNSKAELCRREGEVIREIGTINKNIAGRTNKEWYENNAEEIKKNHKEYRENNAEKIKEYLQKNADKIKEYKKEYRENNAEKIKEYFKEKVCCEICGDLSLKINLKRHQQSKKCLSVANK